MARAARVGDPTAHGTTLGPGPGCASVNIGFKPAWRALPAAMADAVEELANAVSSLVSRPQLTPVDAAGDLARISAALTQGGATAAANEAPGAAGSAGGAVTSLSASNATLSATWTVASALPGGQPAANVAYTEGIRTAAAVAASIVLQAMAGLSDMHLCPVPLPVPPHGPGFVTRGSGTVNFGNLPAAREGDRVFEACGGADPIALGCPTVNVGGGRTGAGGGGGGA